MFSFIFKPDFSCEFHEITWGRVISTLYIHLAGRLTNILFQSHITYTFFRFEGDEKLFQTWQNFPDSYGARALQNRNGGNHF